MFSPLISPPPLVAPMIITEVYIFQFYPLPRGGGGLFKETFLYFLISILFTLKSFIFLNSVNKTLKKYIYIISGGKIFSKRGGRKLIFWENIHPGLWPGCMFDWLIVILLLVSLTPTELCSLGIWLGYTEYPTSFHEIYSHVQYKVDVLYIVQNSSVIFWKIVF